MKKKARASLEEIRNQEKRHEGPLKEAESILKQKIADYHQTEEQKRLEAQSQLQIHAQKQEQDHRIQRAMLAEQAGNKEEAEKILNQSRFVPKVILPKQDLPPGIQNRTVWKFRITNPEQVPDEYKLINEKAIRSVVRALGANTKIPGVEVYPEQIIAAAS